MCLKCKLALMHSVNLYLRCKDRIHYIVVTAHDINMCYNLQNTLQRYYIKPKNPQHCMDVIFR